jgi:hypothetical protein
MPRAALIALLLFGCGELTTSPGRSVPFRVVAHETFLSQYRTPAMEVITTDARWQQVWREAHPFDLATPAPAIDFAQDSIIFVARGAQPSGCYDVDITSVRRAGGRLEVAVDLIGPALCPCPATITYPLEAIAIPATHAAALFHTSTRTLSCS